MVLNNRIKELKLIIFDVDGTLYSQSKLRKIIFYKLVFHYLVRPWKGYDLFILYHFRKEREKKAGYSGQDLEEEQYEWCAKKVGKPVVCVKKVINKWIFDVPNAYLKHCMFPGVAQYFNDLRNSGVKTAVYSDYKSNEKLKYMNIEVDMQVSSTDKTVNSFKPLPKGLLVILGEMGIENKSNCLYIGDRMSLDGVCAKNAGIPFLLIDKENVKTDFYFELSNELINSGN